MIQQAQSNRLLSRFTLISIAAVAAILFFSPISRVVLGWFTFEESHGLLIFAVSLYIVWASRERLRGLPKKPNLLLGSLLLLSGCLTYLSAKWSSTLLLEQISLVQILLGITCLILGNSWFKTLFLPIFYLLFMFTAFQELLFPVSGYMQQITAWIASGLLRLTGMPVLLSGNYITLPHITLVVARECDGSHHIVALLALAIPLAYYTQENWIKRSYVILAALLVGMLANGLRVMLIGLWSASHKTDQLHGPFNLFYASFIFFFGMLLLTCGSILTASRARRGDPKSSGRRTQSSFPAEKVTIEGPVLGRSSKALPSLIALMFLSGTLALASFREPRAILLDPAPTAMSLAIEGWRIEADPLKPGGPFDQMRAHEEFCWLYRDNAGRTVRVYIGYFPAQHQDSEIINEGSHWQIQEGWDVAVPLVDGSVTVRKIRFHRETTPGDLYFFYLINGRILTSRYAVKLATMLDAVVRKRTNGAIIAIFVETIPGSNPLNQDEVVQFLTRLIPTVRICIPS